MKPELRQRKQEDFAQMLKVDWMVVECLRPRNDTAIKYDDGYSPKLTRFPT